MIRASGLVAVFRGRTVDYGPASVALSICASGVRKVRKSFFFFCPGALTSVDKQVMKAKTHRFEKKSRAADRRGAPRMMKSLHDSCKQLI